MSRRVYLAHEGIVDEYFEWMCELVCGQRFAKEISFRKLLACLHDRVFTWSIRNDENRATDGINLRDQFAWENSYVRVEDYLNGPCSVLEMMLALAIRCETDFMDDPSIGNRTAQWFWSMITSLGLGGMMDDNFDIQYVDQVITRFLDRDYEPNGRGGLFTIRHCEQDVRDVEIWYQLCWYINSIT